MKPLPLGLKLLAGFFLIFGGTGVFCLLLACIVEVLPGKSPGVAEMGPGMYWLIIMVASLFSVLHLVMGIGVIRRKPWTWWLIVACFIFFFASHAPNAMAGGKKDLLSVVAGGLLLWYWFRPSVKSIFFKAGIPCADG